MERFCDIEVSNKGLTHIHGYQNKDLVSIEEALQPIVPQIDDLSKYIEMAKNDCRHPSEHDLSKDESASVYIYTMDWGDTSLYRVLNKALRSENRQEIKAWFSYLKLFDTALQKLPTIKEAVWRGININMEKKFTRDQILIWWGISSCSLSPKIIEGFLKNSPDATIFLIEAIDGKKVSGYTEFENEEEVILPMGTQLRVKGDPLKQSNGSHIVHLIQINDDNNTDSSSVSKPNDFFLPIRNEYLRNSRIQRMMNEEKTFPMEQSYVNLAIVETKEQQEKEKKLRQCEHNDAIISTFEDIYGSKTSIDIKDMFETCKDRTKKVLVLGRAGIGKSTFCRYVTYQWAKNEIWPQYQLVILIRLRLLTSIRYPPGTKYLLVDLVEKEYFPYRNIPTKDKERFEELCNKELVLWLLDGYDEFVQNIPEQVKDLFNHILKTQHHILTSRPYSIALSYDVKMEITGFTDDNIVKYVEQFFDQTKEQGDDTSSKVQRLLSFLKTNPSIWGVAHIPVNLELICSLWSDMEGSPESIITVTGLYDNMTEWLCRRYLKKQKYLPDQDVDAMFKDEIYEQCTSELLFLENLAFKAMKSNTLIIPASSVEQSLKTADLLLRDGQHILNIGVLKSFSTATTGNQRQNKKDYYFVHLSFQEHFAARYLVNALRSPLPKGAIEFIKNNKYNQRFILVFTFISGLLTVQNLKPSLDTFWTTLLDEPFDLVGFRHVQLIISCLEEVTEEIELPCRTKLIESIRKWIKYVLSTRSKTLNLQLTHSLHRGASLVKETSITKQLIELMNSSGSDIRSNTCKLISALSTYNPQQEFLVLLINVLGDDNWNVSRSACYALSEMGGKATTDQVINKLVNALEDDDEDVRGSACDVLGNIGEKAATSEVISKLVNALEDDNEGVRSSACIALGEMGGKAATSEVIGKLLAALRDDDENVRSRVCNALGEIGEKAATSEVIDKLLATLRDDDENVRSSAAATLGKMGEKAATSEVISKLVNALTDEDWSVRSSACDALGEMDGKATTDQVISKLINALAYEQASFWHILRRVFGKIHEQAVTYERISTLVGVHEYRKWKVSYSAYKALGKIGEKVAKPEVISKLIGALADENWKVRGNVCKVLAKMGGTAASGEVVSKLVNTLEDEVSYVRSIACYALSEMGEKAATSEVISKLVNTLGDEVSYVRSSACCALGKTGERAVTSEVVSKLVNTLRDEAWYVRSSACCALSKMGEKVATAEVISKLVNTLGDKNWTVRKNVCRTLGEMSEKAARSEVISKLINALGDDHCYVWNSACYALGKMNTKTATSAVISKLVNTLEDEHRYIRSRACNALGEMGEKAATSAVFDKLLAALRDDDENVRSSAAVALGKMGEKAATSEVISKLANALEDKHWNVQYNARDALCKMGERAATSEVINKMLELLEKGERVDDNLTKILQRLFTSFTMMVALDSETVRKLLACLGRNLLRDLTVVSPEILIKLFLHTKNSLWLSVASKVALLQGVGITIVEKNIVVYYSKEPVAVECNDSELIDQLVETFAEQSIRFDLPCLCPRKAPVPVVRKEEFRLSCDTLPNTSMRREKHWCSCIVL